MRDRWDWADGALLIRPRRPIFAVLIALIAFVGFASAADSGLAVPAAAFDGTANLSMIAALPGLSAVAVIGLLSSTMDEFDHRAARPIWIYELGVIVTGLLAVIVVQLAGMLLGGAIADASAVVRNTILWMALSLAYARITDPKWNWVGFVILFPLCGWLGYEATDTPMTWAIPLHRDVPPWHWAVVSSLLVASTVWFCRGRGRPRRR